MEPISVGKPLAGEPHLGANLAPRLSVKDFARYEYSSAKRRQSILRRHKFPKGEGLGRMKYYSAAIRTIREYHALRNDSKVVEDALAGLSLELTNARPLRRYQLQYNISAIRQYIALYGKRKFKVLSTPRLKFSKGNVSVGASPDLHVEENGIQLLIKFDFCRTPEDERYVPLMLQLIRDATRLKGLKIKARNIIVFDVVARKEYPCPTSRAALKGVIARICRHIEENWTAVTS